MLKHVSINRFEGNGIIERIEGNGWDIDTECIEMNGVNAKIIDGPENRIISLNGPAVEDLFKRLRDLLKDNGKLSHDINEMKKGDKALNYCANDALATETLHLRRSIKELEKDLKEKEAAIRDLQFDRDHYKESCEILDEAVKRKNERINTLEKILGDKDSEIEELNDELNKKWDFLENRLTVADKLNPILSFISGAAFDNVNFAVKTLTYFMPDYDVTVSVSRKEDKDVEIDKPEKYEGTKEILGWLREMIDNNTDYATKIFNKESKENIFSITFCRVPVEPEVVTNEQG